MVIVWSSNGHSFGLKMPAMFGETRRWFCGPLLGAACFVLVGCAAKPVPLKYVTDAQASITAAEVIGAKEVPKAALHLKMARDQVQSAEALQAEKEHEKARLMLMRARADAELAVALTKEAEAQRRLAQHEKKLESLESDDEVTASNGGEE